MHERGQAIVDPTVQRRGRIPVETDLLAFYEESAFYWGRSHLALERVRTFSPDRHLRRFFIAPRPQIVPSAQYSMNDIKPVFSGTTC